MLEDKRSRTEIIIDEIKCGGFAEIELEDIINVCREELEEIE